MYITINETIYETIIRQINPKSFNSLILSLNNLDLP